MMDSSKRPVSEILRYLARCLRHSYETFFPVALSLRWQPWTATLNRLCRRDQDIHAMAVPTVWRRRLSVFTAGALEFAWVTVIYLISELVIWGLSLALAPAKLEFLASIFGMLLTFAVMSTAFLLFSGCDSIYRQCIKSKVDFINAHLGLGFPIPLVMLNQADILDGHQIACIIGNFIVTNILSWSLVFAVSLLPFILPACLRSWTYRRSINSPTSSLKSLLTPRIKETQQLDTSSTSHPSVHDREKVFQCATPDPEAERAQPSSGESSINQDSRSHTDASRYWRLCATNFPIFASLFCMLALGVPLAAAGHEERILDGCVLWFVWISSVRLQRCFKLSESCLRAPKTKNALATLMNPVLATTLIMTAYTRVKAAVPGDLSLAKVLEIFSSGTPLYTLWTSATTDTPLPLGMSDWFGAGDAALSILECGILIWGFKLYECRRQLFSTAGLVTIIISIAAAAANVFISVPMGGKMGLHRPEALAFAARSTTLALAKPAMSAVGGNLGANAALVVSNGILGQLIYPFALEKLNVRGANDDDDEGSPAASGQENVSRGVPGPSSESSDGHSSTSSYTASGDDPITIAAGITIGVNGAAMGVAYLYETKSRAAPYAALAMTVFGVMTVVFTTVEPFKGTVIHLAGH